MPLELEPHQQAAQHRDEHVAQRGQEVPEDQPLLDQLLVAGQFVVQASVLASRVVVHGRVPLVDRPVAPQAAGAVALR